MTNRREFMQIGIAATLATQASRVGASLGRAQSEAEPVALYKVVYDSRFADSVAFARRAAARGAATHAIEGDMTQLWYDDLYHRWRRGPAAIAGLTAHGPLFCLERLAWDHGMRVVFRSERKNAGDCFEHRLSGPLAMLDDAWRAASAADWSTQMAEVVLTCPSGRAELGERSGRSMLAAGAISDSLYSWVIAPATRA
jgi:hypothetical protein